MKSKRNTRKADSALLQLLQYNVPNGTAL